MRRPRILKRHVGRPVDFEAAPGWKGPINGLIVDVRNGIAKVLYWVAERDDGRRQCPPEGEGFVVLLPVRSPRIVAVH